jgi:hypothetical protein
MVMQKWKRKVTDNPGGPSLFAACSATSKPIRKPIPLNKAINAVNRGPVGSSVPLMFSATNSNKAVIQSRPTKTAIKTKEKPTPVVKKELPKRRVKKEEPVKSSSRARPVVIRKETEPLWFNRKEKLNPIIPIVRKKHTYYVVPEKKKEPESLLDQLMCGKIDASEVLRMMREDKEREEAKERESIVLDKSLTIDASEVLRILREAKEEVESVSSHSFELRATGEDTDYDKIMKEKLKGFLGDNNEYDDDSISSCEYDDDTYSISS